MVIPSGPYVSFTRAFLCLEVLDYKFTAAQETRHSHQQICHDVDCTAYILTVQRIN